VTRYRTIVADPPWEKPDTGARTHTPNGRWDTSGAGMAGKSSVTPYEQMTLAEIEALPIPDLAADDAHLYLWTFGPYIPEAYRLVAAWGFTQSALITGCKKPMGLGFGGAYVPTTEHVLFARRGRDIRLRRWDSTWFDFKRPYDRGPIHSAKPDAFMDIIEQVSPGPRLEMFARRNRLGWDTWGDEALNHVEMPGVA
jgi:N6-adenosine-specific RNA methylase IME4